MGTYSVADQGWTTAALEDVGGKRSVIITVSGPAAMQLAQRVTEVSARMSGLAVTRQLLGTVLSFVPGGPVAQIAAAAVVPVLAAIGAMGGAFGTVAYVGGVAVAHGYGVAVGVNFGAPFDPTDDRAEITLSPPK